jgi:hypothetical protein
MEKNANWIEKWMKKLWVLTLMLFVCDVLIPISSFWTRLAGVALLCAVWGGGLYCFWRRRTVRIVLLAVCLVMLGFAVAPDWGKTDIGLLRRDYLAALMRYDGVRYVWGGENILGIDCSGLARRGLVEALIRRSIRSCNPGLLRRALWIWWHDCTAKELGTGESGMTDLVVETPELNRLDSNRIQAGDLAVTQGGAHVMIYLGENEWIEADPGVRCVITLHIPHSRSPWCQTPMRIMRWKVLRE